MSVSDSNESSASSAPYILCMVMGLSENRGGRLILGALDLCPYSENLIHDLVTLQKMLMVLVVQCWKFD